MKDNRKKRKKFMIHKCEKCGFRFRAFRVIRLNLFLAYRNCPKCGYIPLPF